MCCQLYCQRNWTFVFCSIVKFTDEMLPILGGMIKGSYVGAFGPSVNCPTNEIERVVSVLENISVCLLLTSVL